MFLIKLKNSFSKRILPIFSIAFICCAFDGYYVFRQTVHTVKYVWAIVRNMHVLVNEYKYSRPKFVKHMHVITSSELFCSIIRDAMENASETRDPFSLKCHARESPSTELRGAALHLMCARLVWRSSSTTFGWVRLWLLMALCIWLPLFSSAITSRIIFFAFACFSRLFHTVSIRIFLYLYISTLLRIFCHRPRLCH